MVCSFNKFSTSVLEFDSNASCVPVTHSVLLIFDKSVITAAALFHSGADLTPGCISDCPGCYLSYGLVTSFLDNRKLAVFLLSFRLLISSWGLSLTPTCSQSLIFSQHAVKLSETCCQSVCFSVCFFKSNFIFLCKCIVETL